MIGQRDSLELYRIGTLLFLAGAVTSFIVLFILLTLNPVGFALIEVTALILAIVLLLFRLLFAIALALTERKIRLNRLKEKKEDGQ